MYVAGEVARITDRRVGQGRLDENAKKILNNIVEKMKEPMNLEVFNLGNVDKKKVEEKTQETNQVLSRIHTEPITETNCYFLRMFWKKRSKHENSNQLHGENDAYRPELQN